VGATVSWGEGLPSVEGGTHGGCTSPLPPADPGSSGAGVEAAGRGGGQLEQGLCCCGLGAGEQDWGSAGLCCDPIAALAPP